MVKEKKKILVVEDEADAIDVMTMLLESEGYGVITAGDGAQAIDKARRETPDLIILDVMLPKFDGYKVARMLKFDEKFSHIPIIMVTARIMDKDRKIGMETGANEYVTKPFDVPELLMKIKEILAKTK